MIHIDVIFAPLIEMFKYPIKYYEIISLGRFFGYDTNHCYVNIKDPTHAKQIYHGSIQSSPHATFRP